MYESLTHLVYVRRYLCLHFPWLWCRASAGSLLAPVVCPCRAPARLVSWQSWWSYTSTQRESRADTARVNIFIHIYTHKLIWLISISDKINAKSIFIFNCVAYVWCHCVRYQPLQSEEAAALSSTVRHFLVSQSQSLELLASRLPPHPHNYAPKHTHKHTNTQINNILHGLQLKLTVRTVHVQTGDPQNYSCHKFNTFFKQQCMSLQDIMD